MTAFTWLLALTLRATTVLLVALVLEALLRRATAGARHRLLTLTAIGLLLLPALPGLLPDWELGLMPQWMGERSHQDPSPAPLPSMTAPMEEQASADVSSELPAAGDPGPTVAGTLETSPDSFRAASLVAAAAVSVWLIGVLASLVGLARSLRREGRLLATSRRIDGAWQEALAETQRSLAVRGTVRLLTSGEIETPLTGGWLRPVVLLPAAATPWPAERQRVVLQHELVHVLRGDALRNLAWRLVVALYWFHPLARVAGRHASVAREEACDEAVLGLGNRPSAYARHLLEIAESLRRESMTPAIALPMIDRSQLERRLLMILDPNRPASRGRVLAVVAVAVLAGIVLTAAAAVPLPLSGSATTDTRAPEAVVPVPAAETRVHETDAPVCVEGMSGTFSGTFSDGPSGTELNGTHNGDFALQQQLGNGQWLCARVHGRVGFNESDGSILEMPRGSWVLVETRVGRKSQRMLVTEDNGQPRYKIAQNSGEVTTASAEAWRGDALQVLAGFRQIGAIRGEVGSLHGEIGSIHGEVGSLQGEIGSIHGEEGSLRGKLGSIQGERGSLQGEIGSHRGAIGSLQGGRWQADAGDRARIDREIGSHEDAIKKLESEIATRAFATRIAEAEEEIRTFVDSEAKGRIAELERRIKDVRAEERIGRLEKQIEDLHADDRIKEIERRLKPAVERLKRHIDRLGG